MREPRGALGAENGYQVRLSQWYNKQLYNLFDVRLAKSMHEMHDMHEVEVVPQLGALNPCCWLGQGPMTTIVLSHSGHSLYSKKKTFAKGVKKSLAFIAVTWALPMCRVRSVHPVQLLRTFEGKTLVLTQIYQRVSRAPMPSDVNAPLPSWVVGRPILQSFSSHQVYSSLHNCSFWVSQVYTYKIQYGLRHQDSCFSFAEKAAECPRIASSFFFSKGSCDFDIFVSWVGQSRVSNCLHATDRQFLEASQLASFSLDSVGLLPSLRMPPVRAHQDVFRRSADLKLTWFSESFSLKPFYASPKKCLCLLAITSIIKLIWS